MNPPIETSATDSDEAIPKEHSRKSFSWSWLILAMGIYAVVILSPKIAQQEIMLADYQSLQKQMAEDQSRLHRLQLVKKSIRSEPELAQQILDGQKLIKRGDQEILPITNAIIDQHERLNDDSAVPVRQPHWYAPIVIFIGENEIVRGLLLVGVIVMLLTTFVAGTPIDEEIDESISDHDEEHLRAPNFLSRLKQRYGGEMEFEIDDDLEQQLMELANNEDEWESDALPIDDDEEEEVSSQLEG